MQFAHLLYGIFLPNIGENPFTHSMDDFHANGTTCDVLVWIMFFSKRRKQERKEREVEICLTLYLYSWKVANRTSLDANASKLEYTIMRYSLL